MKGWLVSIVQQISQGVINYLNQIDSNTIDLYSSYLFGTFLCVALGWVIGNDREKKHKPAGISTHTLVILGSMLFTTLSSLTTTGDPTRIASQIVNGIGFLGAGIILKRGINVENLTTAAGIWVSAAIGMAVAFHMYFMALVTTLVVVIGINYIHHPNKDETGTSSDNEEKTK